MSDIINIGAYTPATSIQPVSEQSRQVSERRESTEDRAPGGDVLELSDRGLALARAANQSTLRLARIASIRAEIEANTYETPARIDGTIDRLLDELA